MYVSPFCILSFFFLLIFMFSHPANTGNYRQQRSVTSRLPFQWNQQMRMIGLKTCCNPGAIYCLSFSLITFPGSRLENKLIKLFTTQSFTHGFKSSTPPEYSGFQQITLRQRWKKRLYPERLHKMGKKETPRPDFVLQTLGPSSLRSYCSVCSFRTVRLA